MKILGYIGYAILIIFALSWTLGVRIKLGAGLFTIMGALFYVVAAIFLGVFGINKLHSWWVLPSGFIFVMLCTFILAHRVPLLYSLVKISGSFYAGIIRIGIPSEKIREAQHADAMETIERVFSKTGKSLIEAVKDDDLQAVQILLAESAEVNARDKDGITALVWAAYKGYTEIVELLLKRGAEVDATTKKGVTPLMLAAEQNHVEIIKVLLANRADVNAKTIDTGGTALMAAAQNGHSAIVKLLLENGADIDAVNIKGATALFAASYMGSAGAVEILSQQGANVNAKTIEGATALLVAAQNGHEQIVNLLLQRGAEVNAKTDDGLTPLWAARQSGHKGIAQLLEKAGAKE